MRISLNWLKEFVDVPERPEELGQRLTMVGLAVDSIETPGNDTLFELDVTTNRPDCLNHLGIAREVAAITGSPVRRPEYTLQEGSAATTSSIRIDIEAPDLCGRYAGRYITNVKIGPSPRWLSDRLDTLGVRSINNVADATNMVMLELGQPLHAFDAATLTERRIVVRRATNGETIRTLDGVDRTLDPGMLVIADAAKPVALAGIMGGGETEITSTTSEVLLESAWFAPASIRRTARRLGMSTEASYRYERGADPGLCGDACDRAAALIAALSGGIVHRGLIDIFPGQSEQRIATLKRNRIAEFLGMPVPDADVIRILERLEFGVEAMPDGWTVRVPSFRVDVSREEDLLEEIARHYGFDRFPSTLPAWAGHGALLPWELDERRLRETLEGLGYSEANSLSLTNRDEEQAFRSTDPVVLTNPLSEELSVLRMSLVPTALRTLKWNINRSIRDLQVYEIGKAFRPGAESMGLVLAACGHLRVKSPHEAAREFTFFDLKGDIEHLLEIWQIDAPQTREGVPDYYHPGRSARFGEIAVFGELHPDIVESWKLRQRVYVAEIDLERLYAGTTRFTVRDVPRFPAVRRDISVLADSGVAYDELRGAIQAAAVAELISAEPFDRLEGGPVPEGKYSISISLIYQSADRTLTDAEVESFDRRILNLIEQRTGARLRA